MELDKPPDLEMSRNLRREESLVQTSFSGTGQVVVQT
jgi:hypothetical protein